MISRHTRRCFLSSSVAAASLIDLPAAHAQTTSASRADRECPRCGGVQRIPLKDTKPFVWIEGSPAPKPEAAVGEEACPECRDRSTLDRAALAQEAAERIDKALENHAQWESRTGWKLVCAITRHATLHTQLTLAQAKSVAVAVENLTLHLKRLTGSLVLTPTRPDSYEQIILWEKPSWEQFRKVMEQLYTPEQLGQAWQPAREYNSYDHFVTPHLYETPQSLRIRPPSCGAVFMAARRQINVATTHRAPLWLSEGFAAYGDHAVHKVNRWFSVYSPEQAPPTGDWLADARRLAGEAKLKAWNDVFKLEQRDWQANDYVQMLGMVTFLLESEPEKFLDFTRRLKRGDHEVTALEEAYGTSIDQLELRCARWLIARR